MEGTAFLFLAINEFQRSKSNSYPYKPPHNHPSQRPTYKHKPLKESRLCTAISTHVSSTIHKVASKLHKIREHQKMPPALHVLYIPPDPAEAPQFVRLARKGLGRTVVFLHPNGELYKLPSYALLKGYERDCGPLTTPVFGGKRACEGGCCGWFSTEAQEAEILDYVLMGEKGERPKKEVLLVRHGDVECNAVKFLEEGLQAIRSEGRGWLGQASVYGWNG